MPDAIHRCRQLQLAPCRLPLLTRSRATPLRPKKSPACSSGSCATRRVSSRQRCKQRPAAIHWPARLARVPSSSPRFRRFPPALKCRAQLSPRFPRSTRSPRERQRVSVSCKNLRAQNSGERTQRQSGSGFRRPRRKVLNSRPATHLTSR